MVAALFALSELVAFVAEHKSQHFVPQHYLRAFSPDGRSVRLCHLKSGRFISNASIKDQCCRDYFYGRDRRIEHVLSHMEGGGETVLKEVRETLQLPSDPAKSARLSLVALVLNGRTEKTISQLTDAFSEIMTETARRMIKRNRIELPPGVAMEDIRIKDNLAPSMSLQTVLDMQPVISDLRMKLLLPSKDREFITSDHPTVITNQRFQGREKLPLSGLAMIGIQIVLPLTPTVCLFIYDPSCYRVGVRRQESVVIEREEDIEILNSLQILNANAVVYFRNERSTKDVSTIRQKFFSRRIKPRTVQKLSGPRGGLLFMVPKDDVRIPMQWSFCKIIKHAPTSFAPRDSEVVRLYRKWGDEQAQQRERISFSAWLQQQDFQTINS